MALNQKKQAAWADAKRLCNLSAEEVQMAKELGFQPRSLIKNRPAPSQQWKAPVRVWVRDLYERKIGSRQKASPPGPPPEFRKPADSWPDKPEIPELVLVEKDLAWTWDDDHIPHDFGPPSDEDMEQENTLMLRQQCLFRWAAESVAIAMSELPEVQAVMAFGAVARPLKRNQILHQCADLDLAVWLAGISDLKMLKNAMSRGLSTVQDTPYGGVAHHQVDVHILDSGTGDYRGRLCGFRECPKPGKSQCRVQDCGAQPFLRQLEGFRWNSGRFLSEPRVTLFDRAAGFRVQPPLIDAKPCRAGTHFDEDDVPF